MSLFADTGRGGALDLRTAAEQRSGVFVPLDGSLEAVAALPVARALARLAGATLHLVHVSERPVSLHELVHALRLLPGELYGSILDELAGTPADRILQLASELDRPMVVMSSHSEAAPEGALGPVAFEVLQRASFPVIVVRPERGSGPFVLQRMAVPHDGSRRTAGALGPALGLAERAGAALRVVHVAPAPGERLPERSRLPQYVDQPQHEWPEWAREFLERLEIFAGVATARAPARLFLARGDPGEEIVRFVAREEVDLVAVAWSGKADASSAATLWHVVGHCVCPVLVLRTAGEDWHAGSRSIP